MLGMEMEPGIHQITVGREPFVGFPPPNAFLVSGTDASVLIDAGWDGDDDHAQRMAAIADASAAPISAILLTHRHADHAGGALALHRALGVPLACHPLDHEAIVRERLGGEDVVTQELAEGTLYDLGGLRVEIVFTPGHTLGCLAPYVPELGALFASDTVMGISTTVVRPGEGDLTQYAASLERMLKMGAKTIYTGHGPPVGDSDKRLRTLIEHRRAREESLVAALAGGEHLVDDLRDAVYGALAEPRKPLASAQVQSMLKKLAAEGLAANAGDGRWRLA